MIPNSVHVRTTVLNGGKIEVAAPQLPVGQDVEVVITPVRAHDAAAAAAAGQRSILEIINAGGGPRVFKTAEQVDQYLREERGSWDR